MDNKQIASWARSMAQLMKQAVVTQSDVEMLIDAYELPREEVIQHWTERF